MGWREGSGRNVKLKVETGEREQQKTETREGFKLQPPASLGYSLVLFGAKTQRQRVLA